MIDIRKPLNLLNNFNNKVYFTKSTSCDVYTLNLDYVNEKMSTKGARGVNKSTFTPVYQSPSLMQTKTGKNTENYIP